MEQIKIIKILCIFLLLIVLGFATAITLAFPDLAKYAYSAALGVHSFFMLILFIMYIKDDTKVEPNEPAK